MRTRRNCVTNNARYGDAPFFIGKEMATVVETFINDKAPGLDLVDVKVLKAAITEIPEQFLRVFNGCCQWAVFSTI